MQVRPYATPALHCLGDVGGGESRLTGLFSSKQPSPSEPPARTLACPTHGTPPNKEAGPGIRQLLAPAPPTTTRAGLSSLYVWHGTIDANSLCRPTTNWRVSSACRRGVVWSLLPCPEATRARTTPVVSRRHSGRCRRPWQSELTPVPPIPGEPMHFDVVDAFIIQTEGTQRWQLYEVHSIAFSIRFSCKLMLIRRLAMLLRWVAAADQTTKDSTVVRC